jgi:two-component system response regulator PilR (NtrC family)
MSERILVVDDERVVRDTLSEFLVDEGYRATVAESGAHALAMVDREPPHLALVDNLMEGMNGIELLKKLKQDHPDIAVIIMTAFGGVDGAVDAMRHGALDYLVKPFTFDELLFKLQRAFRERKLVNLNALLQSDASPCGRSREIVGASPAIEESNALIRRVALTSSNVLLTGESGTGKELAAHAIHRQSERRNEVFLPVNCAAIPAELLENELFGHIRGAYTDARASDQGLFRVAEGGTLFLDEICSVPLPLQGKLLRAIELKEILPLGAKAVERVDVRIIAATNKDLNVEIEQGRFRNDLYYRLKVFEITLPPLRDRLEDVRPLALSFVRRLNAEFGKRVEGIDDDAFACLRGYAWKGNVRELENVIERAMIMCDGPVITRANLPADIGQRCGEARTTLKDTVGQFERGIIERALREAEGDRKKAAESLDISLPSLYRKIRELNLLDSE